MLAESAARKFLDSVQPWMQTGDEYALALALEQHWTSNELCGFLSSPRPGVPALAAKCLGLIGSMQDCAEIAPLLGSPDARTASAAEDALWRIWMQAGSVQANARLAKAIEYSRLDDLAAAEVELQSLTESEPEFAEAHHQLGIVLCLLDRYDDAEAALRRAIELNPLHFSAILNLGHVYASRDQVFAAGREYRRALAINPRIEGIAEVVAEIDTAAQRYKATA